MTKIQKWMMVVRLLLVGLLVAVPVFGQGVTQPAQLIKMPSIDVNHRPVVNQDNPLNIDLVMDNCGVQYCNDNPGVMGGSATSSANFALINQPFTFTLTTGPALSWSQNGDNYNATFGQGGSFQMTGPDGLTFTGFVTTGSAFGSGPGYGVQANYFGQWSNGTYGEGATDVTFEEFGYAYATLSVSTVDVLHTFTHGLDGAKPLAGLTIDQTGNLYGTAIGGGCGFGTVFKTAKRNGAWLFDPLYCFTGGSDGSEPVAGVIFGSNSTLYGTTQAGGGNGCANGAGCGTVFNLRPPPTACKTTICLWNEQVLYRFTGGADGGLPGTGNLVFDQADNIYGTARSGGTGCSGGCGVVFELTPSPGGSWTESVLYNFTGRQDGVSPWGGLVFDNAGNLYGTTLPLVPITAAPFLN